MPLSEADLRKLLKADCQKEGSQTKWAMKHDLSSAYVSDLLYGRRPFAKRVLKALGVKAVTTYEVIKK